MALPLAEAGSIPQPDLASPAFRANPYPFFARLRAEAPVYRARFSRKRPMWLISRYEDAAAVLKDERFVKDPQHAVPPGGRSAQPWVPPPFVPLTRNMLDLDAPDHTRLRALVHKAFTPRYVARLHERIQALADDLLDDAERRGNVDLIRDFALPLPVTVIADMLGVPAKDRHLFARWSHAIVSTSTPSDIVRVVPEIVLFMRYVRRLIRITRANPGESLTSALVRAEEAGDRLSEDELVAMIITLLIAGHETTKNLIGNGTLALLQHPDEMDRLRRQPDAIKAAVEELLRYTSPVFLATERYAREAVTLHDETIPPGALVLAVLGSANRDPHQFPDPDALDLTREPNRHLAFGQGSHYCLGAPLARMEGQIAFQTLLRRFPDLRFAASPESLRWQRGLFLRGLERLPVAVR